MNGTMQAKTANRRPSTGRCATLALLLWLVASLGTQTVHAQNSMQINGVGEYLEFGETALLLRLELAGATIANPAELLEADIGKRLSLRLVATRSPRTWSQLWIQNLSINNTPQTITRQTDDLIALSQALKGSLQRGDLVVFERVAADLTVLYINSQELAAFNTPGFFEFLLSAFVGAIPPSSELKAALLAAGDYSAELNARFESLGYSAARAEQIAAWIAPEPEPEPEPPPPPRRAQRPAAAAVPAEPVAPAPEPEPEPTPAEPPTPVAEAAAQPQPAEPESPAPATPPAAAEAEEAAPVITAESLLAAQNYQSSVLKAVYAKLSYPSSALRRNRSGSLRIELTIAADGSLLRTAIVQNAPFKIFDRAAERAVQQAAPFAPIPALLDSPMTLQIPVAFRLD